MLPSQGRKRGGPEDTGRLVVVRGPPPLVPCRQSADGTTAQPAAARDPDNADADRCAGGAAASAAATGRLSRRRRRERSQWRHAADLLSPNTQFGAAINHGMHTHREQDMIVGLRLRALGRDDHCCLATQGV